MLVKKGHDTTVDLQKQYRTVKVLDKKAISGIGQNPVCVHFPKEEEKFIENLMGGQRGPHLFYWLLRVNKEQLEQTSHAGLAGEAADWEATQEQEQI